MLGACCRSIMALWWLDRKPRVQRPCKVPCFVDIICLKHFPGDGFVTVGAVSVLLSRCWLLAVREARFHWTEALLPRDSDHVCIPWQRWTLVKISKHGPFLNAARPCCLSNWLVGSPEWWVNKLTRMTPSANRPNVFLALFWCNTFRVCWTALKLCRGLIFNAACQTLLDIQRLDFWVASSWRSGFL